MIGIREMIQNFKNRTIGERFSFDTIEDILIFLWA